MIFGNLQRAYDDGNDMEAREAMALASFYAGLAFTKAYVGYVHAFSHKLGGMYGVPHGLANAITLPYVRHAVHAAELVRKRVHVADVRLGEREPRVERRERHRLACFHVVAVVVRALQVAEDHAHGGDAVCSVSACGQRLM